jgi:hypothetical protein
VRRWGVSTRRAFRAAGNEQLQVANKTKVSNRKKKCCIFAVVVIFLLVLLGPILGSMLSAT